MISNLALKYEGFNPKVGSTYIFYGLNPSIEDSGIEGLGWSIDVTHIPLSMYSTKENNKFWGTQNQQGTGVLWV